MMQSGFASAGSAARSFSTASDSRWSSTSVGKGS
jgi:hypothetical protein